jgi:hypothetical protein
MHPSRFIFKKGGNFIVSKFFQIFIAPDIDCFFAADRIEEAFISLPSPSS